MKSYTLHQSGLEELLPNIIITAMMIQSDLTI